jgi:hypothetical protein
MFGLKMCCAYCKKKIDKKRFLEATGLTNKM